MVRQINGSGWVVYDNSGDNGKNDSRRQERFDARI